MDLAIPYQLLPGVISVVIVFAIIALRSMSANESSSDTIHVDDDIRRNQRITQMGSEPAVGPIREQTPGKRVSDAELMKFIAENGELPDWVIRLDQAWHRS